MSSIEVQGSSSGAGKITIIAPITANNRTLTLPDQNGILLSSAGAISVNAATPASSLVLNAGGNLGVGTSLPLRKLVVSNGGAQGFEFGAGVGLSSGNELLNYNRSTGLYVQNTTYASAYAFYTGTAGTTRAVDIDSTGNVAIGTTVTSGAKFTVYTGTSNSGNSAIFSTNDGTYNTFLQIQHSTAGITLYNGNSQTATANNLIFGNTATAETMRLDYNGNLFLTGSGTQLNTGFTNRLNVNGSIVAGSAASTSGSIMMQGYYGNGALAIFGTEYSSGGPSICYGSYPSGSATGTFLSSTPISAWRAAYNITGLNGHVWYQSTGATTVPVGGSVTAPEVMRIDYSGSLILAGSTAQKASGTAWSNPSDQRLKNNIRDFTKGTAELMQVRVREWEYNGKGGTTVGMKGIGVVADEVMLVLPDTVQIYNAKLNSSDEETSEIKQFDATEITWLLVKTVQEQQMLINQLTERLAVLETRQG
jgi:hypothetical protein